MTITIKPQPNLVLNGVKIKTIHPKTSYLYFLGPRLGHYGKALRDAQKALEEYSKKIKEYKQLELRNDLTNEEQTKFESLEEFSSEEKHDELHIDVIIESLKQQYILEGGGNNDNREDWLTALGDYITDDHLGVILNCMSIGKSMTREQLHDYLMEQTKNPVLLQEAQLN